MNWAKLSRLLLQVLLSVAPSILAQAPTPIRGADERFKVDILVVVAHPDDEGAATPYLARAIYDLHKKVAVVYGTRGGSGANEYGREHGPAMANIREMEARQACARLDITNVWFLDGKDTASQNVLNSLASWGHGENLEKLVGLIRLTRPDIIMTWLPGVFIGENHGDHQAAGVLATEAFDLAADPVAFPSQIAGPSKRLEPFLENLQTWQPKKIYYFEDSASGKQFASSGPSYSIKEVSPSKKHPYWRLAFDAIKPHLTQFGEFIQSADRMSEEQLSKMIDDPDFGWPEPETLIFGKSYYASKPTDDVFANLEGEINPCPKPTTAMILTVKGNDWVALGGPWIYYNEFKRSHCLESLPIADPPEIAVKSGSILSVPLIVYDEKATPQVTISADVPQGWKIVSGTGQFLLPAEANATFRVDIQTPTLSDEELKKATPLPVKVTVRTAHYNREFELRVLLKANALPQ